MKKIVAFIMVCTLLLAGLSLPVQAEEIAGLVRVNTVDQLLDAIRPGAIIELEPGDYCLQDASGYGTRSGEYWYWQDCYDGYELIINGADDLTLITSAGTQLLTAPRYANVLNFYNCRNITVNGLTVGHSPEQGACCGGVINLENCAGVTLENCVLFGCGVTAVIASDCENMTVRDCFLTECSYSGAELYRCEDVLFDACTFSYIGDEDENFGAALYTDSSRYVTLMNCVFNGNRCSYMLRATASSDVAMLGCESLDNFYAFFYLEASDVMVVNCGFRDMTEGNAVCAAENPGRLFDMSGNELTVDSLLLMKSVPASVRPARTQKTASALVTGASSQHYYEVSTADELIAAIGSHRVICLSKDIDLSTATNYGIGYSDCWRWEQTYDGAQLIIFSVKDLTLMAKQAGVTLLTSPRSAAVLTFSDCRDIKVEGLSAGHTEMPEYDCSGAVLVFDNCMDIEVEDCALFGCGTVGVEAYSSCELEIEDTEIFDCSLGGIILYRVQEVEIEHCSIHDCAYPALYVDEECESVEVDGRAYLPGAYDPI